MASLRASLAALAPALLVAVIVAGVVGVAAAPAHARGHERSSEARALFDKGQRLYQLAKFQEALEAFSAAYEAEPLPEFLFNIGQCHRRLGEHDAALYFYRGYLDNRPDAPDRGEVERLIAEVEAAKVVAEQRASQPPAVAAPTPTAPVTATTTPVAEAHARPVYRRWWLWTAIGAVVVAGAIAAIVLATQAGPDLPSDALGRLDAR